MHKIPPGFETSQGVRHLVRFMRHVLLNMLADYDTRKLTSDIKKYFERNQEAIEVLIFKGNKVISVNRRLTRSPRYYAEFKKMYEK